MHACVIRICGKRFYTFWQNLFGGSEESSNETTRFSLIEVGCLFNSIKLLFTYISVHVQYCVSLHVRCEICNSPTAIIAKHHIYKCLWLNLAKCPHCNFAVRGDFI